MGSDICIYAKNTQGNTQTICTLQQQSVREMLGLFKHIVYSFALQRYPYNQYQQIKVRKGYYKIASIKKDNSYIYVKIPSYHVLFLNCKEQPLPGVHMRTNAFESNFTLHSHDDTVICYSRVVDV